MLPENKVNISVIVDKEVKDKLEKYSKLYDCSMSKLASNLIYASLNDLKILNKTSLRMNVLNFKAMSKGIFKLKETNGKFN